MSAVTVNCALPPSVAVPVGAMLSSGVSLSLMGRERELAASLV